MKIVGSAEYSKRGSKLATDLEISGRGEEDCLTMADVASQRVCNSSSEVLFLVKVSKS